MTKTGDTFYSHNLVDNFQVSYDGYLKDSAYLYASGRDLKDPMLSPIYGDLKGFPPTILISGTRDLFLSRAGPARPAGRAAAAGGNCARHGQRPAGRGSEHRDPLRRHGFEELTVDCDGVIECRRIRRVTTGAIVDRDHLGAPETSHQGAFPGAGLPGVEHVGTAVEVYEDAVLVLGRDRLRGQAEDIDAADRRLFELDPELLAHRREQRLGRRRDLGDQFLPLGDAVGMNVPRSRRCCYQRAHLGADVLRHRQRIGRDFAPLVCARGLRQHRSGRHSKTRTRRQRYGATAWRFLPHWTGAGRSRLSFWGRDQRTDTLP